jgi:predicted dehydrogenase
MKALALVGCGHWGPNHIRTFNSFTQSRVKTIVDTNEKRLVGIREHFTGIECVRNIDVVLRSREIDAVVISSPTSTHYEVARACLLAGKDVLCEKPLATTFAHAEELVHLAERAERVLMVGHIFLFNSGIMKLKEVYQSGELGVVQHLAAVRTNLGPIRTDVNAAYDLATHDIAIFNWLLDSEPETISATGQSMLQYGIEDVVSISMRYPDGVFANLRASWLDPKKVRQISVVGTKRMATWDDLDLASPVAIYDKGAATESADDEGKVFRVSTWDGSITRPEVESVEPLRTQNLHFLDALDGKPYRSNGRFAAGVVRTVAAAARSLALGGTPIATMAR